MAPTIEAGFVFSVRKSGSDERFRFARRYMGAFTKFLELNRAMGITSVRVMAFQETQEVILTEEKWQPIAKLAQDTGDGAKKVNLFYSGHP